MKRPAFQFYAKDWRGNLKLRRCSDAAKGAWIEIMCVLHDSEEYGVVRFPLKELVNAAGVQVRSARELVHKGVLKGGDRDVQAYTYTPRHAGKALDTVTLLEATDGPMWYCSRFVRDEYIRQRRGESTRFDTENQPKATPKATPKGEPKASPKPPIGERQGDGSAFAFASAVLNPDVSTNASSNTSGARQPVDKPLGETPGKSKPRARGTDWWRSDEGIIAEGKRVGIPPRSGELMPDYKQRIFEAKKAAA